VVAPNRREGCLIPIGRMLKKSRKLCNHTCYYGQSAQRLKTDSHAEPTQATQGSRNRTGEGRAAHTGERPGRVCNAFARRGDCLTNPSSRGGHSALKKHLALFAIVLTGLFSGGAALALTADSPPPRPTDTTSTQSSDNSSTESTDSSSTESTDSASDDQSSNSSDSTDSQTDESSSTGSGSSDTSDNSSESSDQSQHPANHGADVSSAAHTCPQGPHGEHGKCVSAVAHGHN
jgi:hypothetical protein